MLCFGAVFHGVFKAIVFVSHSLSCMVYNVSGYLFIDIFNDDVCPIHIFYHQLVVHIQCCSVCVCVCVCVCVD